ncbi:hypothetical protein GA0061084_2745 [Arthrobacter sp. NIO-1057]|nr:hypothetical protein GA0061084_2745 [Arthrobacter sp. NIO-1057]
MTIHPTATELDPHAIKEGIRLPCTQFPDGFRRVRLKAPSWCAGRWLVSTFFRPTVSTIREPFVAIQPPFVDLRHYDFT